MEAVTDPQALPSECVACGRPCPPPQRWCSTYCFYAEDGYPDDGDADDEDGGWSS